MVPEFLRLSFLSARRSQLHLNKLFMFRLDTPTGEI